MTQQIEIHPEMTMEEIQERFPSSRRALFMRYHIGGCSTCAYQPTDTLAQVCQNHNLLDVNEVIRAIHESHEADQRISISVEDAKKALDSGEGWKLIDVRSDQERELANIEGSIHLTPDLHAEMIEGDKEARLIFFCHTGVRSLDSASFYAGHRFPNVRSLSGGIDEWSQQVDPNVPRY